VLLQKQQGRTLVEYLDYQIPVTQLKGPKGNGRLSDTRYSAKGTKGKWSVASLRNKLALRTIVEVLDYQIPVTQLKGPKGNGDMQAANLWLRGR